MTKTFHSIDIGTDELREIIEEMIREQNPGHSITKFNTTDAGIDIGLDDGQSISIEIDWNEFVLRYANGFR